MLRIGRAFEGKIRLIPISAEGTMQLHDTAVVGAGKLLPIDIDGFGKVTVFSGGSLRLFRRGMVDRLHALI